MMNEGLKRHIRYVSMYQAKTFFIIFLGGLIYGLFMIATSAFDSPADMIKFIEMMLAIFPCSLILNYIRYHIDFCLSMGCTRRNIYLSIYVLAAELLAESLAVVLLLYMVTSQPITVDMILSYIAYELVSIISGIISGFLIRRFGYAKMLLVLLLFYIGLCFLTLKRVLSLSSSFIIIGSVLILYGLVVTFFVKQMINRL